MELDRAGHNFGHSYLQQILFLVSSAHALPKFCSMSFKLLRTPMHAYDVNPTSHLFLEPELYMRPVLSGLTDDVAILNPTYSLPTGGPKP